LNEGQAANIYLLVEISDFIDKDGIFSKKEFVSAKREFLTEQ
jgi:hypothetical protein